MICISAKRQMKSKRQDMPQSHSLKSWQECPTIIGLWSTWLGLWWQNIMNNGAEEAITCKTEACPCQHTWGWNKGTDVVMSWLAFEECLLSALSLWFSWQARSDDKAKTHHSKQKYTLLLIMAKWRWLALEKSNQVIFIISLLWVCIILSYELCSFPCQWNQWKGW